MPVNWDEATFASMYSVRIRDPAHPLYGQRVGYSRTMAQRMAGPYDDALTEYIKRRDWLIALGIQTTDRILIAGCGFGFLIEAFHDAGYASVWGIDNSAYIANRRGIEARGDTLLVEDDIRGGGRIRAALRSMTGDDVFQWVVSESVLESYPVAAERDQLLNAAEAVLASGKPLSNIVHMVVDNPGLDPVFAVLTLEQWNAIRPSHSWMSLETGRVL